jgi:hypothetical protein
MKIIANVDFSAQLRRGDCYELPDADARLLVAAGLAHFPVAAAEPSAANASVPSDGQPASTRRAYQRRDRQATDSRDLQASDN